MFNVTKVYRAVRLHDAKSKQQKRARGSKHVVDMFTYTIFLTLFIFIYLAPDSDQDNYLFASNVR